MGLTRLQGILTRCLLPLSLCRTKQLTRVILYHNVAVCELPRRLFIHAVFGVGTGQGVRYSKDQGY